MCKSLVMLFCVTLLVCAAWLAEIGPGTWEKDGPWIEVAPGILRTTTLPAGYALDRRRQRLAHRRPATPAGLAGQGQSTRSTAFCSPTTIAAPVPAAAELLKKGSQGAGGQSGCSLAHAGGRQEILAGIASPARLPHRLPCAA